MINEFLSKFIFPNFNQRILCYKYWSTHAANFDRHTWQTLINKWSYNVYGKVVFCLFYAIFPSLVTIGLITRLRESDNKLRSGANLCTKDCILYVIKNRAVTSYTKKVLIYDKPGPGKWQKRWQNDHGIKCKTFLLHKGCMHRYINWRQYTIYYRFLATS